MPTESPMRARSRRRLCEAVTQLLDDRDPGEVTITDVVREAGLTRPTFYAIWDTLPAAFAEAAVDRLNEAFDGVVLGRFDEVPDREGLDEVLRTIMVRLQPHAGFYAKVLTGPSAFVVQRAMVERVCTRIRWSTAVSEVLAAGPVGGQVAAESIAAAIMWIITRWLEDHPGAPLEDVVDLLGGTVWAMIDGGLGASAAG